MRRQKDLSHQHTNFNQIRSIKRKYHFAKPQFSCNRAVQQKRKADEYKKHDQRRNLKFTARQPPQSERNHANKENTSKHRSQNRKAAEISMKRVDADIRWNIRQDTCEIPQRERTYHEKREREMVQRQAEFLSFAYNLCINCPADLAISRLVPF